MLRAPRCLIAIGARHAADASSPHRSPAPPAAFRAIAAYAVLSRCGPGPGAPHRRVACSSAAALPSSRRSAASAMRCGGASARSAGGLPGRPPPAARPVAASAVGARPPVRSAVEPAHRLRAASCCSPSLLGGLAGLAHWASGSSAHAPDSGQGRRCALLLGALAPPYHLRDRCGGAVACRGVSRTRARRRLLLALGVLAASPPVGRPGRLRRDGRGRSRGDDARVVRRGVAAAGLARHVAFLHSPTSATATGTTDGRHHDRTRPAAAGGPAPAGAALRAGSPRRARDGVGHLIGHYIATRNSQRRGSRNDVRSRAEHAAHHPGHVGGDITWAGLRHRRDDRYHTYMALGARSCWRRRQQTSFLFDGRRHDGPARGPALSGSPQGTSPWWSAA